MNLKTANILLSLLLFSSACSAEMNFTDDGAAVTVSDSDRPVLTYHYAPVEPPEGVEERYTRSCYIHPLYGLDGDILTQDFPRDHYHHRGIFWVWPESKVGDRLFNLWLIQGRDEPGARQHFEKWLKKEANNDSAEIGVQNVWRFDDDPTPIIRESVWITVHSAEENSQSIDIRLAFKNVCEEDVTLLGAAGKGYGGFCLRPDAKRRPLLFSSALGSRTKDLLSLESPWADVSSLIDSDSPYSGVSIFQHPGNPGYPHPGWILRAYGFLGASWPHLEPYTIKPGKEVELQYRLFIHRGTAEEAGVGESFEDYVAQRP